MQRTLRIAGFSLVCALVGLPALAQEAREDPDGPLGSSENPTFITIPDSLLSEGLVDTTGEMAAFLVAGERIAREERPGRSILSQSELSALDAGDVASVAPALASTRMQVNSRGEALFSIRGSPERHVVVALDGIPLVVPWDERSDLSMLPLDAVGGIEAKRGVHSALDGVHALAGRVDLKTRRLGEPGRSTRFRFSAGEVDAWEARASTAFKSEDFNWDGLVALGTRDRDGTILAEGQALDFHQDSSRRTRTNSDQDQLAALASVRRVFPRSSELRGTFQWSDGAKGVPPEGHLDDARFWRYPNVERYLLGLSGHAHLDEAKHWRLSGFTSFDDFHQEIRPFDDDSYTTPALAVSVDYETGDNRTMTGQLTLRRQFESGRRLSASASGRWAKHEETLVLNGPEEQYSQNLLSFVAEWDEAYGEHWHSRLGGGYEHADTPKTGDKPDKPSTDAPVAVFGFGRTGERSHVELRASRRSRFPSMRESFSGALGRFELNPDLGPETQDLVELDWSLSPKDLQVGGAVFGSWVEDAIERTVSPNDPALFTRANVSSLRTLGAELSVTWSPPIRGFTVATRLTGLQSRVEEDGAYDRPAEDRPEFLASSWISWSHASGLRLRLENLSVGERWGADNRSPSGLSKLPSQTAFNARASYLWVPLRGPMTEWFVRVANLLDAPQWSQVGLPESGRTFSAGVTLTYP